MQQNHIKLKQVKEKLSKIISSNFDKVSKSPECVEWRKQFSISDDVRFMIANESHTKDLHNLIEKQYKKLNQAWLLFPTFRYSYKSVQSKINGGRTFLVVDKDKIVGSVSYTDYFDSPYYLKFINSRQFDVGRSDDDNNNNNNSTLEAQEFFDQMFGDPIVSNIIHSEYLGLDPDCDGESIVAMDVSRKYGTVSYGSTYVRDDSKIEYKFALRLLTVIVSIILEKYCNYKYSLFDAGTPQTFQNILKTSISTRRILRIFDYSRLQFKQNGKTTDDYLIALKEKKQWNVEQINKFRQNCKVVIGIRQFCNQHNQYTLETMAKQYEKYTAHLKSKL